MMSLNLNQMKNTIEEVLEQQRKKTSLNIVKISQFLYNGAQYKKIMDKVSQKPLIPYDFNLFNESRVEMIKKSYTTLPIIAGKVSLDSESDLTYLLLGLNHQMPTSVSFSMFVKCIQIMGTDEQVKQIVPKIHSLDMIGCYAQTELGHGSDIRGLQTTATWVEGNNQFIINSPTITAAKYWPGDLGISSNYALVFAQLIIKDNKCGVQPFLVKIRDENHKPMPGVEVGDIGPKIGFFTKDNGYLLFSNVRIPKWNMLRKYVQINEKGQLQVLGDPTSMYATMMIIRQHISCIYPKIYSQAITIGYRYSIFRKQFINQKGEEIPIINYQLQQEKLIPRIAQYYAMIIGGNAIKKLCEENLRLVTVNSDSSLMAETHACLSVTKSLYGETVLYGMDIIRRSCGGHGFSHYSGLPNLIQQYFCHVTHEGENSVLYLQTARYIVKSLRGFLNEKKPLPNSLKYLESFDYLINKKEDKPISDWTIENFRILLAQSVCYLVKCVLAKLSNKTGQSQTEIWNYVAGVKLQQLAVAHGCYYTFNHFREAVISEGNEEIKQVLNNVLAIYGINLILTYTAPIAEGGFIHPQSIKSLKKYKQELYTKIRPQLSGLVDALGMPERLIRSQFIKGNPYENMLQLARKSQLNKKIPESGIYVRRNIVRALHAKL